MPRDAKLSKTFPFALGTYEYAVNFDRLKGRVYPSSPILLKEVAEALLLQIERSNKKLARELKIYIHLLSVLESLASSYRLEVPEERIILEKITKRINYLIAVLKNHKPSKLKHWAFGIHIQRDLLLHYLQQNSFPLKARNPTTKCFWFKEHYQRLLASAAVVPCFCLTYLGTPQERPYGYGKCSIAKAKIEDCKGKLELVWILLSAVHKTSEEKIKQYLKPLPSFPS